MRFYQNEEKNHFAMIGGILNFISVCLDSMRSVLNEKLCFALKDGTSFQSLWKHLRSKVTQNVHLTYSKMGETWGWYYSRCTITFLQSSFEILSILLV